ncbi:MAG: hypothetical protein DRH15_04570 [Deltaproteobacteria bacterium]|nr:MAG: hypothetical protein DRH15_04570 [Deltaproteobacteria bacterium]
MYYSTNNKKYRLLFSGLIGDVVIFKEKMARKGVKQALVEQMLKEAPIIIKQNLTLEAARKYADSLSEMGARITILDQLPQDSSERRNKAPTPMSHFVLCPRCGLVQQGNHVCARCGLDLAGLRSGGESSVSGNRA